MSDCKHEWSFWLASKSYICDECNASITVLDMALQREEAEARVKELEEDLKGEAMELQAKKILLNNAGLTISKYQSKISDVTLDWIAATERVKELEDAIAAALRIKELWGPSITGDVMENRALYIMLTKFEELVK